MHRTERRDAMSQVLLCCQRSEPIILYLAAPLNKESSAPASPLHDQHDLHTSSLHNRQNQMVGPHSCTPRCLIIPYQAKTATGGAMV